MSAPPVARDTLAIIGAGPVGLEAAAHALELGFDVHVFERGEVAAHVIAWGHVDMFTPWRMNVGPASQRLLTKHGWTAPEADAHPSGTEFAEQALVPLAETPELKPRVHSHAQVVQVSRRGALRSDAADSPPRANHPFRLLVRDVGGRENFLHAHTLLDASGVMGAPNALGTGGIPARQELYLAPQMSYQCDDVLGARRARYAGKRTLVVGGGAGAVTAVLALAKLAREAAGTSVAWAMRRADGHFRGERPGDPLAARAAMFAEARALLAQTDSPVTLFTGCETEALEYNSATHRYRVQMSHAEGTRAEEVDHVLVQCGYGQDRALIRELHREECPRSGGPLALSRALEAAGAEADQLAVTAESLAHPEPGYFEIGAKAHGRRGEFLLTQGHAQVAAVMLELVAFRDTAASR